MSFITRNFFRGVLVLAPFILTAYIFYLVFTTIDQLGRRFIRIWMEGLLDTPGELGITGAGFVLTFILLVLVGYLSSMWIGSPFLQWLERQFLTSKITRGIYGAIRGTLGAIFGEQKIFSKVVLVNFPNLEYQRIGFVTQDSPSFIQNGEELTVVYFPHSFQVSGNMVVVPKRNVQNLEISTETALKMIMSAGIVHK